MPVLFHWFFLLVSIVYVLVVAECRRTKRTSDTIAYTSQHRNTQYYHEITSSWKQQTFSHLTRTRRAGQGPFGGGVPPPPTLGPRRYLRTYSVYTYICTSCKLRVPAVHRCSCTRGKQGSHVVKRGDGIQTNSLLWGRRNSSS